MAGKPLTTEAIALTEKKMDMTLDDIIKMTKSNASKPKKQRVSNRSQKYMSNAAQEKSARVRRFMDSRSSIRQGVLAQRRSNFQGNHFPLATEAAQKAALAPIGNRAFNGGRGFNVNQMRVAGPTGLRKNANGSFTIKVLVLAVAMWLCSFVYKSEVNQPQPQGNSVPKQRPQTLDSLFANMKEQRMRALSQHHSNGGRQNGGGPRRQQWRRSRFVSN